MQWYKLFFRKDLHRTDIEMFLSSHLLCSLPVRIAAQRVAMWRRSAPHSKMQRLAEVSFSQLTTEVRMPQKIGSLLLSFASKILQPNSHPGLQEKFALPAAKSAIFSPFARTNSIENRFPKENSGQLELNQQPQSDFCSFQILPNVSCYITPYPSSITGADSWLGAFAPLPNCRFTCMKSFRTKDPASLFRSIICQRTTNLYNIWKLSIESSWDIPPWYAILYHFQLQHMFCAGPIKSGQFFIKRRVPPPQSRHPHQNG